MNGTSLAVTALKSFLDNEAQLKRVKYYLNARSGKDEETGCVIMRGACTSGGFPKVSASYRGKQVIIAAKNIVYALEKEEIPIDMTVNLTCGDRKCINPEHMEARRL